MKVCFFFSPPTALRGIALSRKGLRGRKARRSAVPFSNRCSLCLCLTRVSLYRCAFFHLSTNKACAFVFCVRRGGGSGSLPLLACFWGVVPRVVFPVCFSFVCSRFLPCVVLGSPACSRRFARRGFGWSGFRLASGFVGRRGSGRRRRFVRRCLCRRSVGSFPSVSSSVVGSRWLAAGAVVVGLVRVSSLVLFPLVVCSRVVRSRLAPVGRLGLGRSGCCSSSVGCLVVRVGSRAVCSGWFRLVSVVRACRRGRRGKPAALFRERRTKK